MPPINQVERTKETGEVPQTNYANCGRRRKLTPEQEKAIVAFVKEHRNKRYCCCRYIRAVLKAKCTKRTIANALNRHGYHWRAVPKVRRQTATRRVWPARQSGI